MNKINIYLVLTTLTVTLSALWGDGKVAAQQIFVNNGVVVTSTANVWLHVTDGGITNQDSGTFDNSGTIKLTGDWENNASNAAFINSSPGQVILSGDTQLVTGSSVTQFFDLIAEGTGIKQLTINARVEDSLVLNDREVATDSNTLFVLNPDTGIITRTTGFISSLDTGSLSRNTNMTESYLFPVGSSVGTLRYRPVEITPDSASAHTFTVRMANVDATLEGFDRTIKDSSLSYLNPEFYHRINRTAGTDSAAITIYFDSLLDYPFSIMAHWQNQPRWENMGVVTLVNSVSPSLSSITKFSWDNFSFTPFILTTGPGPVALVGSDTIICTSDSVTFTATPGFSNYEFLVNGNPSQNGSDSSYTTTSLSNGDVVTVVATDSLGGQSVSNTVVMTVNPVYTIAVAASICSGDSLQLPLGSWVDSAGIYTDILSTFSGCDSIITTTVTVDSVIFGAASITICQGDSIQLPGGGYIDTNGVFNDTLLAVSGCDSIIIATSVTVNPVPSLSFIVTDETCIDVDDGAVDLTVSGGVVPYTFLWDDLNSSVVEDLSGLEPGTYTVIVTDSNMCSDSGSVDIEASLIACYIPYVFIPNIFSPNGDGKNDMLFVLGKGIDDFVFIVYERWGSQVFETTSQSKGWDGTYKGKALNEAVFVYYIKAQMEDGQTIEKKGNISLVR